MFMQALTHACNRLPVNVIGYFSDRSHDPLTGLAVRAIASVTTSPPLAHLTQQPNQKLFNISSLLSFR